MESFTIIDILHSFRGVDSVAYCYSGTRVGAVAIMLKDGNVSFFSPLNFFSRDTYINLKYGDMSKNDLWVYIEDIGLDRFEIREEAVCAFQSIYNQFYTYLPEFQEDVIYKI